MNRSELTAELSDKCKISGFEAKEIVDAFFKQIEDALKAGRRVEIRDFGTFTVKKYKSYIGRNPKSGESVTVDEKVLPVFRGGGWLKRYINKK